VSGHTNSSLSGANFLIRPSREERFGASSADSGLAFLTLDEMAKAARFFHSLPGYVPTPLVRLTELARQLGVAELCVKDESARLGLNSFKALGVSYAIARLLEEGSIRPENARGSAHTLVCASAGNHGRAVAHFARANGFFARVYVSESVSEAARRRIENEGAEVIVVSGDYDASVAAAVRAAEENGWTLVSDHAWPGYEKIPRYIMAGYTMLFEEASQQLSSSVPATTPATRSENLREDFLPTVVIVQTGVGGLLGAAISWFVRHGGEKRPAIIAAEPTAAACMQESLRAGREVNIETSPTIMTGLKCGTVSSIVWPMAQSAVDACIAISDDDATRAVETLAHPAAGDAQIFAGPSGACGVAALVAATRDEKLRPLREKYFGPTARVLVINSEGPVRV
jgi:diaminopropionate ammonia-lyase